MNTTREIHRQEVVLWAKTLINAGNWCVLDTETTGLDTTAEICEISLITPEHPMGFTTRVKPTVPISIDAQRIHGISDADCDDYPFIDALFPKILKVIGQRDLVIYNADFDLRLLKQSLKVHGIYLAFPTSDRRQCRIFTNGGSIHCCMKQYAKFVGEKSPQYGDYRYQKLPGGDHSAYGDCLAVVQLMERIAAS